MCTPTHILLLSSIESHIPIDVRVVATSRRQSRYVTADDVIVELRRPT